MIQLTYQPAFDAFHATFRFLRLRQAVLQSRELARDHIRILDFYLLFPFRTDNIRLMPKHRRFKKIASQYVGARPYGELPDDRILFNRMGPIQAAALDTLTKKGFLDDMKYKRGIVSKSGPQPAQPLLERVHEENKKQEDLISFLVTLASEYQLLGPNGLKDRTGLLEFAYDAI